MNIVHVMGDVDPTFKCDQDRNHGFGDIIEWYEFYTNANERRLIADLEEVKEPYRNTHAKNGTNLRILSPNLSVAGRYVCEGVGVGVHLQIFRFPAELIVLGKKDIVVLESLSSHGYNNIDGTRRIGQ